MYRLVFFTLLAIPVIFGNEAIRAHINDETHTKGCGSLCSPKDHLSHVNMLLSSLQPTVDPCQDFYSFACSGYVRRFGNGVSKTVYDDAWHSLQVQIKDMLVGLKPDEESLSGKMKTVYDTCMNDVLSELRAVPDALNFLNSIGIRNWPHLDLKEEYEGPSLSEIMGNLAVYDEFSFVTFKPSPYGKEENGNSNGLPTALVLPDNFLLSSKMKPKDVENTVRKVLAFFDFGEDSSNILWKEFSDIENMGIRLQNDGPENSHRCMDGFRGAFVKMNCSEDVQESLKFLCNIWKASVKSGNLEEYFTKDSIHLSCRWNQFHYVENIFSNLTSLTERSVINYLAIRFFVAHLDDLNLYFQRVRKLYSGVRDSKFRASSSLSRWEYCVAWLIKCMNLALGYEYTKEYFNEAFQKDVSSIIQQYVEELINQVEQQNWIKDRVKTYLQNQIRSVKIGFQTTMQNYRNKTLVESCYNEFHPVKGSFLKSMLELQKLSFTFKEKDETHFNGFYSSSDPYTMDFGFALFLPPTYSFGLSKLWNYATLGFVIGHELSHNLKLSFDLVYLDDQTENNLNEKTKCYVQQYSQFFMEKIGKRILSKETEEEIFADNVGWSLTEKILEPYLTLPNDSLSLPGYDYTPRQLMYIKFAQACCEVLSPDVEKELYSTNPQSVEKFRVLGLLQNSKMFSETFHCSPDAIMNPVSKCNFFK